jgi:lipopolysaccharide/colanic/teichoic acid biosynthesis glycosyltransferase
VQVRGALFKGALDRLVALLVLVVLAPLLLVVAAALLCDGGHVFVRQERVGIHGRRFHTLAFRTTGSRVGPLLHRYSIVDLPQLLNVVGGSMSLVGPRPPLADEDSPGITLSRLPVKPGLTGLPDPGTTTCTWEDTVAVELDYAEHWTPALDARILGRSLWTAMHGDKAA